MKDDLVVQLMVLARFVPDAPPIVRNGDRYLVSPAARGSWAGHENAIVVKTEEGWNFTKPEPGWRAYVQAEGITVMFDGLVWKEPDARPLHVVFTEDGIPGWIGREPRDGSEPIEGLTIDFLAAHLRQPDGLWIARPPPPPPSAAEVAARQTEEARAAHEAAERARKMEGILFEGVWCSATSADQSGLLAVLTAIQIQQADFQPTRFEFENGSRLVIHLGNYSAFMAAWLPFRQSFFRVI